MTTNRRTQTGFIGGGNMAMAMISGILEKALLSPGGIIVSDPDPDRRAAMAAKGVAVTENNVDVFAAAGTVFLCVKPQMLSDVLPPLSAHVDPTGHLLVSILAGVPTSTIESHIPDGTPVVRVMPNTPMLVGKGAAAVCPGSAAGRAHLDTVETLLRTCARVFEIDETMMDALTAVSGSGPAYLFYLAESMIDAAMRMGFPADQAVDLVEATLDGAATLLKESDQSATRLREMVTSKGGTTQAAIETLNAGHAHDTIVNAMIAARDRSKELGKGN